MPMSEHEQYVLEQLEQEFSTTPSAGVGRGWLNRAASKRIVVAAIGLPVGVLLMLVALILNSAGGVVLALAAYGLILASVVILVDSASDSRATLPRRVQSVQSARRPWYFQ